MMEKGRSSSVPRINMLPRDNPPIQGYQLTSRNNEPPLTMRRNSSSRDIEQKSITANAGKEIMKVSMNSGFPEIPDIHNASPQKMMRMSRTRQQGSWGQFMNKQGERASQIEQTYKMEDKLRTLKYKEALEQMIKQEKQKKKSMEREIKESNCDPSQIEAYLKYEKLKEQEDKKKYFLDLQKHYNDKEAYKRRELIQKSQENLEFKKMLGHIEEYDKFMNIQDKMSKQQLHGEYKKMIDQKQQMQNEQKRREEEVIKELSSKESHFFYKQDEERRKLFEKIRNANNGAEQANYLLELEFNKKKQYEDFVNKAVQEKTEKDTLEMMRRQEMLKKHQIDTFEKNRMQTIEKVVKSQKEKQQREEEHAYISEHRRHMMELENFRKQFDSVQKKDYLESLKSQANARIEARLREDEMNNVEKFVNFRKPGEHQSDDDMPISLPLNGRSYERSLQLKYIDKWLGAGGSNGNNQVKQGY